MKPSAGDSPAFSAPGNEVGSSELSKLWKKTACEPRRMKASKHQQESKPPYKFSAKT